MVSETQFISMLGIAYKHVAVFQNDLHYISKLEIHAYDPPYS